MIDFRPLIQPAYWFKLDPGYMMEPFSQILFVVFSVCILAGAIIRIVARQKAGDKFVRASTMKAGVILIVMGVLGFVWYFFTYEGVSFFGARFWFLAWVIGLVVWFAALYRYVRREIPLKREQEKSRASANKYLPRRNG